MALQRRARHRRVDFAACNICLVGLEQGGGRHWPTSGKGFASMPQTPDNARATECVTFPFVKAVLLLRASDADGKTAPWTTMVYRVTPSPTQDEEKTTIACPACRRK